MGIETDPLSYLTRRILILRSAKPVCPNFEAPGHPPPPRPVPSLLRIFRGVRRSVCFTSASGRRRSRDPPRWGKLRPSRRSLPSRIQDLASPRDSSGDGVSSLFDRPPDSYFPAVLCASRVRCDADSQSVC